MAEIEFSLEKSKNMGVSDKEQAQKLKQLLRPFGINVSYYDCSDKRAVLEFSYQEYRVEIKGTRRAGRKKTYIKGNITVAEVENIIKNMGAVKAAASLGMSKSGMYARLKRARSAWKTGEETKF